MNARFFIAIQKGNARLFFSLAFCIYYASFVHYVHPF